LDKLRSQLDSVKQRVDSHTMAFMSSMTSDHRDRGRQFLSKQETRDTSRVESYMSTTSPITTPVCDVSMTNLELEASLRRRLDELRTEMMNWRMHAPTPRELPISPQPKVGRIPPTRLLDLSVDDSPKASSPIPSLPMPPTVPLSELPPVSPALVEFEHELLDMLGLRDKLLAQIASGVINPS
jgi:hypothetical protein